MVNHILRFLIDSAYFADIFTTTFLDGQIYSHEQVTRSAIQERINTKTITICQ